MTLEAIKQAISLLSADDKASLMSWLHGQDAVFFSGGATMASLDEWIAKIRAVETVPLPEFLSQRNTRSTD